MKQTAQWTMERGLDEFKNLILAREQNLPEADVQLLLRHPLMNELVLSGLLLRMVITDMATGKYVYASPAMDEYFDPALRQVQFEMGWSYINQLIHPEDGPDFGKAIVAYSEYLMRFPAAEQANCLFVGTYRIQNRSGQYRKLLQQVYPFHIRPTDTTIRYVGIVLQDITNIKPSNEVTAYVLHRQPNGTDEQVPLLATAAPTALPETPKVKSLSKREQDVLRLLMSGQNNRMIAETLQISMQTVMSHRRNLMRKTRTANAAQLAAFALQSGLV